jgi:1,4-alpha-glucan branching enzyme
MAGEIRTSVTGFHCESRPDRELACGERVERTFERGRAGNQVSAQPVSGGVRFRVWAAEATTVAVECASPERSTTLLEEFPDGTFGGLVSGIDAGSFYRYRLACTWPSFSMSSTNHLGPEGNYLPAFSRYHFAGKHDTTWGKALNFDGPKSSMGRQFAPSRL